MADLQVTWRELLEQAYRDNGDDPSVLVTTLTNGELHRHFDPNGVEPNGQQFTAWTERFVYFPVFIEFADYPKERVGSVPRNPDGQRTEHIGW